MRRTVVKQSGACFLLLLLVVGLVFVLSSCRTAEQRHTHATGATCEPIRLSEDGTHFVSIPSRKKFTVWGVNYDHDDNGRLLEEYWNEEWATVVQDFEEIKDLGANVVRIHLQTAKFMEAPDRPNRAALKQLARLVVLAEETGLYLNVTGLGCYHKQDVPAWYDAMNEEERWKVQSLFWESVARVCADSPAIFCYDLMNEPILPGKSEDDGWLAGEFGGKYFVQRISLDAAGRTSQQVAKAWMDTLIAAIRKYDKDHLITLGVIPWAHVWPNAKPIFYAEEVCGNLDFVSVHFYPKTNEIDKAIQALSVYDIGKPLVIEEMFPLSCSIEELDAFIEKSRTIAEGWIGFYWGKPVEAFSAEDTDMASVITLNWLRYFEAKSEAMVVNR
jgi:hypothetical protein